LAILSRNELLRLARVGAQARVRELRAEIDTIVKSFPDLRRGGRSTRGFAEADRHGTRKRGRAKTRRGWTAAQRKEAAERMRKYWAGRKANKNSKKK
jgi:hypothetical protein